MKYVLFDENGRIKGFYSDDVNSNIPSECYQITDEVWQQLLIGTQDYKIVQNTINDKTFELIDDIVSIEAIVNNEANIPTVEERLTLVEQAMNDLLLGGM